MNRPLLSTWPLVVAWLAGPAALAQEVQFRAVPHEEIEPKAEPDTPIRALAGAVRRMPGKLPVMAQRGWFF